jgi:hydroxyacylglutathione hydrolase
LDFRPFEVFFEGFIPGSILYTGSEAEHQLLQKVIEKDQGVVVVANENEELDALALLQKQGFKNIGGWLEAGFEAWQNSGKPIDMIISIDNEEALLDIKYGSQHIIDIRTKDEYESGHIEKAEHFPAVELLKHPAILPKEKTFYIYCNDGRFSAFVISVLKKFKLHNFYHLQGGFEALNKEGAPVIRK